MKVFCYLYFLFVPFLLKGQANEPVETINVSIDSVSQFVTIKWKPLTDTSTINWYVIYEYRLLPSPGAVPSTAKFISKKLNQHTFYYPSVITESTRFVVLAQSGDSVLPPPVGGEHPYKNISKTIFNEITYDSCHSNLILTWNNYWGWGSQGKKFDGNVKEYQIINHLTGQIVGRTTDTTYTLTNVTRNSNFQYRIKAIQASDNTIYSMSNVASAFTKTMKLPNFINAESATYNNNKVDLVFHLDASSNMNDYTLTRASSPTDTFLRIADYLDILTTSLNVTDPSPLNSTAYYRLEALNYCNQRVLPSNLATDIVPNLTIQSQTIELTWDDYLNWPGGVLEYQIFQKLGTQNATLYQTVAQGNPKKITQDINKLAGLQIQGNICYYITAISNDANRFQSISRMVCTDLIPEAFIPNAFTPDGNGQNDWFTPTFTFLPHDFKMMIYDRYGFLLFETSDFKGWNGLLKNNKKAPEGTYIYFITYSANNGKKTEKKGSFTLIYP